MSFLTGTNTELIYASPKAANAKNTFTSEITINDNTTGGLGALAHLPADFWLPNNTQTGRGIHISAKGIVSSTATPSYTWTIRFGAASNTSSAIVLGSAALATASGISNAPWYLEGDVILETLGAAGTNSTVRGTGYLLTDGYSAATTTRIFQLYGGAATPGTVATVDTTITNYINLNITCTASSSSNTITLQQMLVWGLN